MFEVTICYIIFQTMFLVLLAKWFAPNGAWMLDLFKKKESPKQIRDRLAAQFDEDKRNGKEYTKK